MSVAAMTWAFGVELRPATAKFTLVALADNADDAGRAFPSIDCLVSKTCLDRKTVIASLATLEEAGLIRDSGHRVGRTKQVKVYLLQWKETVPKTEPLNSTESGTGPENGTVPNFPGNSTVFPMKGSRFSVETVPKTGHGTIREPSEEPSRNHQGVVSATKKRPRSEEPPPSNLNVEAWHRWVEYRREIRRTIKPVSIPAAQRKLAGFGADQGAVVEQSIANGWQGLFALGHRVSRGFDTADDWRPSE